MRPANCLPAHRFTSGSASLPRENAVITASVLEGTHTTDHSITSNSFTSNPRSSSPSSCSNFSGRNPWLIRNAPWSTSNAVSLPSGESIMVPAIFSRLLLCVTVRSVRPIGMAGMCCHSPALAGSSCAPSVRRMSPSRSFFGVVTTNSITDSVCGGRSTACALQ